MAKFKVGDPIWVLDTDRSPPVEAPGTIAEVSFYRCFHCSKVLYGVDVPGDKWAACESLLRPRRDDYQQHEPLGSRESLDEILYGHDDVPVLTLAEPIAEEV